MKLLKRRRMVQAHLCEVVETPDGWSYRCVLCPYESAPMDQATARVLARMHEAAS